MDLPTPPADTELRNIIDKLAQFVARNGPVFEEMTKNKQKGNPKFQFLYGGEYYNYYKCKVNAEQQILKQQGIIGLSPNSWSNQNNGGQNSFQSNQNNFHNNTTTFTNQPSQTAFQTNPIPPSTFQSNPSISAISDIDPINQQQEVLREQIKQSEQNLTAQHTVLMQQQQAQIESTILKCETAELQREASACNINLQEMYGVLQPIIDSCTKDSISNGKSWILQHAASKAQALCIAHCLLHKVVHESSPFSQKLHIIYLVNDVLHHCARKNANELKDALESVVVAMFCSASVGASEEVQKNKLDKLLKLWESKANYLAPDTVQKMRQPTMSFQQYQADQLAKYASDVNMLSQQTKSTFDGYQAQHQAFVCHAMAQIVELEQQKQSLEVNAAPAPPPTIVQDTNGMQSNQNISLDISFTQQQGMNPPNPSTPTIANDSFNNIPPMNLNIPPPIIPQPPNGGGIDIPPFNQPPPGFFPTPAVFPDFSKPPPGFPVPAKPEPQEELLPSVPYYDLPAGLMVPLMKLEDTSFKPLDPKAIRLPPPAPPSDRLLAAVEAFYAPPSHERPRDSEGWEKLGLYEYYKAKNNAKKEKEEQIKAGLRPKSRSPSPVMIMQDKSPSPPKRRYTSKSPSPPPKERRSRSRSPRRRRSRGSKRRKSNSRSRSRSPVNRSPSPPPPSFSSPFLRNPDMQELDSSNKGHQMLRKMGWGGSGLGLNEQGIDTPISGGDVRDRQDQFKGVGCNLNDPYENFRKNKGAAFITRMKARAEERANETGIYKTETNDRHEEHSPPNTFGSPNYRRRSRF